MKHDGARQLGPLRVSQGLRGYAHLGIWHAEQPHIGGAHVGQLGHRLACAYKLCCLLGAAEAARVQVLHQRLGLLM